MVLLYGYISKYVCVVELRTLPSFYGYRPEASFP